MQPFVFKGVIFARFQPFVFGGVLASFTQLISCHCLRVSLSFCFALSTGALGGMAFFQRQWLFSPVGRFGLTRRQRWNCSEIFNGNSSWLMLVVLWMVSCISLCTCNLFDFVSVFFCVVKCGDDHILIKTVWSMSYSVTSIICLRLAGETFCALWAHRILLDLKALMAFNDGRPKKSASTKRDLGTTSADIPLVCRNWSYRIQNL